MLTTLQKPVQQWTRHLLPRTCIQTRSFSRRHVRISTHEPVELSYNAIIPEDGNATEKPLVILHGLFGSKRNWTSICKALHRDMPHRPIYALDMRNHGTSPHATPMTYEAMASDVHRFIEEKKLKGVALLGHSMGGKVAMTYALSVKEFNIPEDTLSHLIVADIAPSIGKLSTEFSTYISIMQKIEALPPGVIKTRSDADARLKAYEPDLSIRQFLLTNLHVPSHARKTTHHEAVEEKAKFIVPLGILSQSMDALGSFPYDYDPLENVASTTWDGPTLVVKGKRSAYINHKNIPALHAFFPNMRLEELDTGHWVHAEKPTEFRRLVVDFLSTP
ncbi:mitochondrial protein [Pholiota conissans]|uniref:Mitochondrial protein n=1 Tax=Pholiota conissans TaxID=109636 RepID=A0A9P5Z232_9AGAR|nr:mitochondrial protein [Pholiota conissans]